MVMRRYGQVVCLTILLAATGCSGEQISPQVQRQLDAGLRTYEAGDDRATIEHADAVLRQHVRGAGAMQAYYLRGMAKYRLKEYPAAEWDLEQVYRKTKNNDLYVKAADTLGELAYLRGDMALAASCLQKVIDQTSAGVRPWDHAQFRMGCVRQRQGRWKDADLYFDRVMYYVPGTPLARQGRRRVHGRKWTIQVGSYKKKQNTVAEAEKFRAGRMETFIEPVVRDGELTFLLRVGRWDRYEQAEKQLPSVRKMKADAFLCVTR
ncbi:MAG: SPOR domain-containing protein [Candidatus Hydrogenedentes bacterium]|nr:SPOR domain-containing protein [Candidatus Hydrogenedentota bacterium]